MKNILRSSNIGFTKWCVALIAAGWMGAAANAQTSVFSENMGTPTGTTAIATYATGTAPATFQNKATLTFTGTGDMRATGVSSTYAGASGGGNVFLTSPGPKEFQIAGINTTGFSTFSISFGVSRSAVTQTLSELSLEYSSDGTAYTAISIPTQTAASGWIKLTLDNLSLPATTNLRLRFKNNSASASGGQQIRLDDISLTASGSSPSSTITLNPTSLSGLTTTTGANSSVTNYTVTGTNLGATNVTVKPNSSLIEVSTNASSGFATNALTLTQTGGVVSNTVYVRIANVATATNFSTTIANVSGTASNNLTVSGSVTAVGTPSVIVFPTSATGLTNYVGQVSAPTNYTVTGTNLGGTNLVVTASTNAIEVSTNSSTGYTNSFSLAPSVDGTLTNVVYVRISALAPAGAVSAMVSNVSGAASNNFTVSGTVTQPALTLVLSPTTVQESAGADASTGTVGIPFSLTNDLTVSLVSSNTAAATVPSTVTITNGQTNATFAIAAVANRNSYTDATAVITASQANYTPASATLTVQNVDVSTISLTSLAANSYTQNFDGLGTASIAEAISGTVGAPTSLATATGSSPLSGWYASKIVGTAITATAITADDGNGNSGLVYNYGVTSATDRALGVLASGTSTMAIGALIKNDTGGAIDGIKVSFTAEFWRSSGGTSAVQNILACAIGKVDGGTITTANFLTAGSAAPFISGNITGPAAVTTSAALNGNDAANQSTFTDVVIPLVLAPGETGFVRWSDVNDGGNDAGLAIDNLKMTAVVSSVPTPELSLAGGIYLSDQNLKVSNFGGYAAGTTVYYTVDGSTPTSGSTVYNDTTGIALTVGNGPIAVKVIAIQGGLESFITSATYDLPKDVANLTALRASATGSTIYRVIGPVTFTAGTTFRKTKFFQDSGAGIQIDDLGVVITTPYLAGDNVSNILGRILLYQGQLQMVPLRDFGPAVSSGNVVTPLSRTLATLTDADQSRLVTIPGVEYQGANGTLVFTTATATINTAVRDSSTGATYSGWVRNIFSDSDVTGKVIPTGFVTVTGIVQKTLISSVQSLTVGPRNSADAGVPAALRLSWSVDLEIPESGLYFDPEYQYLTLSRVGNSTEELQVLISCNPESRLSLQNGGVLPQTITIPAGTTSAQVKLMPVDDSNYTGNTLVTITATAANHTGATTSASILEDEVPDEIKPGIELLGENPQLVANGATYTDLGAKVTDNIDADRTIMGTGTVNTAVADDYTVTYNATDAAGNVADAVTRTVRVAAALGSTFAGAYPDKNMTDIAPNGLSYLANYGFGGSEGIAPTLPIMDSSDSTKLKLIVVVRTDDSISLGGETSTDLAGSWSTSGVSVDPSTDASPVPANTARKVISVDRVSSEPKRFLRATITK
jgi:hypothetical protein